MSLGNVNDGPTIGAMMEAAGSGKTIDEMLKDLGLIQDPDNPDPNIPFAAFFFLTFAVFGQTHQNEALDNIDGLATNLKELTKYFNLFNEMKNLAYDKDNSTQYGWQFFSKAKSLVNLIAGKELVFNDGNKFSTDDIRAIQNYISTLKSEITENKPSNTVIGNGAVIDTLNNILALNNVDVVNMWKSLDTSTINWDDATSVGNFNTAMKEFSKFTNTISEIGSRFEGVSGATTSTLQFNQNNYNQMMSFYKEMLNDWSTMKKASNGAMSQARN